MVSREYITEVIDAIIGAQAERAWDDYSASYQDYNRNTPIRQSLRRDDFLAYLADSTYKKVVVWDGSGNIAGMGICTFHLDRLPWINAEFFRRNFPSEYGRILHLVGMYVRPGQRGLGASVPLMLGMRQLVRDRGGRLVGFDCSAKLQAWLPGVVMQATGGQAVGQAFESGELDRQVYWLLADADQLAD